MKTLLRSLLYLALIVWLGAEIFFPVVAAITFATLTPDKHTAGLVVGALLRILHGIGFVSGIRCMVSANDAGIDAGALQPYGLDKTLRVQELALENRLPYV